MFSLGFPKDFANKVMERVKIVRFSIATNEEWYGFLPSIRSLRQGDPILPILCYGNEPSK